jgi:hypothetical protein
MKRALSGWSRAPRELRRPFAQRQNIALVPASELSSLKDWQERARSLPAGNTLVVIPRDNDRLQEVGRRICDSLEERGRPSLIATTNASSQPIRISLNQNAV